MSVGSVLATVENDAKGFMAKVSADWQKVKQAWTLISSPQTRSLIVTLSSDAIKTVKDATPAVESAGMNLTLDAAVVADIQKLVADAKSGDGVIRADLQVLGITL